MNEEPQVLYCDAWLMAIDKPAGMIVHGDGTGERTLTDYASDLLLAMGDGFAATDMQPAQPPGPRHHRRGVVLARQADAARL